MRALMIFAQAAECESTLVEPLTFLTSQNSPLICWIIYLFVFVEDGDLFAVKYWLAINFMAPVC